MKIYPLLLIVVCSLAACASYEESPASGADKPVNVRKRHFNAKVSARFNQNFESVPKYAYVFPPLRMDQQAKPLDVHTYRVDDAGELKWMSDAPLAAEIKAVIEEALSKKGFVIVPFGQLTESTNGHSVLVFTPYYTEAAPAQSNTKAAEAFGWVTFTRITAATFPEDLNPQNKIDIINQELLAIYNGKAQSMDVVKRSARLLIQNLAKNETWQASVSLLR